MAKGKFTRYAEALGGDVGLFVNKAIASTLKHGLKAAIKHTKHDSSLAAYHWMIIPKGGALRPGNRREAKFQHLYGVDPVGQKGGKGKNASRVRDYVLRREVQKTLNKVFEANKGSKNPVSVFAFYNATPGYDAAEESTGGSYRSNAKIEEAMDSAYQVMNEKFKAAMLEGRHLRSRPIGGAGMAGNPFPIS